MRCDLAGAALLRRSTSVTSTLLRVGFIMKNSLMATGIAIALYPLSARAEDHFYDDSGPSEIIETQLTVHLAVDATYYAILGNDFGYGGPQQGGGESDRSILYSFWDQPAGKTLLQAYSPSLDSIRIGRFGDAVNTEGNGNVPFAVDVT